MTHVYKIANTTKAIDLAKAEVLKLERFLSLSKLVYDAIQSNNLTGKILDKRLKDKLESLLKDHGITICFDDNSQHYKRMEFYFPIEVKKDGHLSYRDRMFLSITANYDDNGKARLEPYSQESRNSIECQEKYIAQKKTALLTLESDIVEYNNAVLELEKTRRKLDSFFYLYDYSREGVLGY